MGKITGFMDFGRELPKKRDPKERINDFKELYVPFDGEKVEKQAARCMNCGVPFCHYFLLITSQSLQGEFVLHHARQLVY